jgi:hypothetical protein
VEHKWIIVLVVVIGCVLLAPFVLVALGVAVWLFVPSPPRPPNQVPAPAPAVAPEAPAEAPRGAPGN